MRGGLKAADPRRRKGVGSEGGEVSSTEGKGEGEGQSGLRVEKKNRVQLHNHQRRKKLLLKNYKRIRISVESKCKVSSFLYLWVIQFKEKRVSESHCKGDL